MTDDTKIAVEQNPYNGKWDVGWRWDDGEFTPYLCGYRTKAEAEAEIPGFDKRVEKEAQDFASEQDAEEREQNERYPNLGYVREQIKKLWERSRAGAAWDAQNKLYHLLDMDLAEHIRWPLPSWKAIKSGRPY